MNPKKLLLIFLTALLISGCSANSIFELKTEKEEFNIYQGRELVWDEDSTATVLLNFERQKGNNFEFYTEITNNSDSILEINPADISAQITDAVNGNILFTVSALDPELKINQNSVDDNNGETAASAIAGLYLFFGLVNAASDISGGESIENTINDAVYWTSGAIDAAQSGETDKNKPKDLESLQPEEMLRRVLLQSGEYTGGYFYIPVSEKSKLIRLIIPLRNKKYEFLFKQKRL